MKLCKLFTRRGGQGALIYSGSEFQNFGELGDHLGDVDLGQVRYFNNGSLQMYEMLGFKSSSPILSGWGHNFNTRFGLDNWSMEAVEIDDGFLPPILPIHT